MPIIRSSLTITGQAMVGGQLNVIGTTAAEGGLQVTGNSVFGVSTSDLFRVFATRNEAGARGLLYADEQRVYDHPTNTLYVQSTTHIYDFYYFGDPATTAGFRCGASTELANHPFWIVNFSSSAIPIQSAASDPLGNLPASSSVLMLGGVPIAVCSNQLTA